ncbi:MAG: ATP-dependent DNA helicase RecG [Ruminococcaceae bacterium]|nr:ATP-dependent DNA helicase RecG [Oscillospiraceae bacterium]
MNNYYLNQNVNVLKGVGEKRAKLLRALSISTIEDLICAFPRGYEDRTVFKRIIECKNDETVCIKATVLSSMQVKKVRKNLTIYTLPVSDGTGTMHMTWFNIRFLENKFQKGDTFVFYGKISLFPKKTMASPIFEKEGEKRQLGRIYPVYSLTSGLNQNMICGFVKEALLNISDIPETLPDYIIQKYGLFDRKTAIFTIHFPKNQEALKKARKRLVFEELFTFQTALYYLKGSHTGKRSAAPYKTESAKEFVSNLPFKLTNAQMRVIDDICNDFESGKAMQRLVSGDVGSGKTIVAACAMYITARNGFSSAMMVPTEILARQHFENLKKMFSPLGIETVLLLGGQSSKEKKALYERINSGEPLCVVGTHALLFGGAEFSNLGLVITDEQHRFGVNQRKTLGEKAVNPHTLVMTATPIPRTMALILYGDLDISMIDELPPGRQKVDTYILKKHMHEKVYDFIRKEVSFGRQAFIVCPLVEDSENMNLKSVTKYAKMLSESIFPDLSVAFLHGKMKPAEKEAIMEDFAQRRTDILCSTSVIEVGVDIPNASVMVIENAERFGLSQLHQLRGRVGRGKNKSYCFLFNESGTETSEKRMETMKNNHDGFKIAETDLSLRGPGEFFGTRQHGLPVFKIADLYCDMEILNMATLAAKELISDDFELKKEKNTLISTKIKDLFNNSVTIN